MLQIVDLAFMDPEEYGELKKDIAILSDFIGTQAARSKPIPAPLKEQITLLAQLQIVTEQKEDADKIKDMLIKLRKACEKERK